MSIFGKKSSAKLSTCHRDLQTILRVAIKNCPVDFGVHEGQRSDEKQLEYFLSGASRIDPRIPEQKAKGKHLCEPSEAADIHVAEKHNGKSLAWDDVHLGFLGGYLISTSHHLYKQGEVNHVLRWGGDWDNDGVIALDQRLKDLPHFELIKPNWD